MAYHSALRLLLVLQTLAQIPCKIRVSPTSSQASGDVPYETDPLAPAEARSDNELFPVFDAHGRLWDPPSTPTPSTSAPRREGGKTGGIRAHSRDQANSASFVVDNIDTAYLLATGAGFVDGWLSSFQMDCGSVVQQVRRLQPLLRPSQVGALGHVPYVRGDVNVQLSLTDIPSSYAHVYSPPVSRADDSASTTLPSRTQHSSPVAGSSNAIRPPATPTRVSLASREGGYAPPVGSALHDVLMHLQLFAAQHLSLDSLRYCKHRSPADDGNEWCATISHAVRTVCERALTAMQRAGMGRVKLQLTEFMLVWIAVPVAACAAAVLNVMVLMTGHVSWRWCALRCACGQ